MNRLLPICVVAFATATLGQTTTDAPARPNLAVIVTFPGDLATVSWENQLVIQEAVTVSLKVAYGTEEVTTGSLIAGDIGSIITASLVENPTLNPTLTILTVPAGDDVAMTMTMTGTVVVDDEDPHAKLSNFWNSGWGFGGASESGGKGMGHSAGKGMGKGEVGGKGMGKGEVGGKGMGNGKLGGKGMGGGRISQLAWFRAGADAAPVSPIGKSAKVGKMRQGHFASSSGTPWRDGEAEGAATIHGNGSAAGVAAGVAFVVGAALMGLRKRQNQLNHGGYEYIEATENAEPAVI